MPGGLPGGGGGVLAAGIDSHIISSPPRVRTEDCVFTASRDDRNFLAFWKLFLPGQK